MGPSIIFGAKAPRIDEQLRSQGYKLDMEPLDRGYLQRDADEVTRLADRSVLTQPEQARARCRLLQIIREQAKPL